MVNPGKRIDPTKKNTSHNFIGIEFQYIEFVLKNTLK